MNNDHLTTFESSARTERLQSFWQLLKSKRISYFTLPLIFMATIVEVVILTTGWKYQRAVCVPQGMGVTFFGIGPIGAVILAVEMLKLPLAIWTASRAGWQKGVMVVFGLPLICVLTFQLVKDMAVYEMGIAMTPATQMLEKATTEEVKISQLKGDLANVTTKRTDRERKLTELSAKKEKARVDFEEALKLNAVTRQDAISLTDYQKQSLSEVEARQASVIKQAEADSAQLQKGIAELHARREVEVARASNWNEEEARIENDYKGRMADYANKRATYEKELAAYNGANFLKRKLMTEPVDPGVPPVREENKILKPVAIAEIDAQIKAKEIEMTLISEKRRQRVAQIEDDARKVREQFDSRSTSKREETDRKREELVAAKAKLDEQFAQEEKQINADYSAAAATVDGVRAQIDASTKAAEDYFEQREAAIRKTQVYRIATTVEIVRGLLMGQRPVTIKATAKERGDLYTDQISMVRIWVYPVLAFIVAFLPTLMVEIGFSTLFQPEEKRRAHRLGFFGRRMHALYMRAGRFKIGRAERLAREASAQISNRDRVVAEASAAAEKAIAEADLQVQAARHAAAASEEKHQEHLRQKEGEWVTKYTELVESLNRAIAEKDAAKDFQKTEVERQLQLRQNAWSDRLAQLNKELDEQRSASEAERTTLIQEHRRKMMEVTEDCKTQVMQARRQMADAELVAVEETTKMSHDLKEALNAREILEAQLNQQNETFSTRLTQAKEESAREVEKATRIEKQRAERLQVEFEKTMRQREEDFDRRLRYREQELTAAFDSDLAHTKAAVEDDASRREMELQRQLEARMREIDVRWKQEVDKLEDSSRMKLQQREEQLQTQAEVRLNEARAQAEEELRRREAEMERQLNAQAHDANGRLAQELQQKEIAFHARLKQREVELAAKAAVREAELQTQWSADMRAREEKWQRQADARVQSVEALQSQDAQQKEVVFESRLRQRDQEWQAKMETFRSELRAQTEEEMRRRDMQALEAKSRELKQFEVQVRKTVEDKHAVMFGESKQREQELAARLASATEACQNAEKERDDVRQLWMEKRREVHDLNNKLMQVSAVLGGLRPANANGASNGAGYANGNGNGNGNGKQLAVTTTRNS